MEVFAQYTPALKSLILLRMDTDLSVKENHFIALRGVELSPKLDLLRDSYFRVFDKLMALEKMVEIE